MRAITNSLGKIVSELDNHYAAKSAEVTGHDAAIAELNKKRDQAQQEAEQAVAVKTKIEALIS